jgi:nitroreductase
MLDTAIKVGGVAENVCLQATSLGLGTVFVAGFNPEVVQKVLNIPSDEPGKLHDILVDTAIL